MSNRLDGDQWDKEGVYKQFFESFPEAIMVLDKEGRVVRVNSRVREWMGWEEKELLGKSFFELPFLTSDSKKLITSKFAQGTSKENLGIYDLNIAKKDGSVLLRRQIPKFF